MIRPLRKLRAAICRRRGHPYPTRPVDGVIGGQRVRLAVCVHCDVIRAGDVLPTRKVRRYAKRHGVDPLTLIGPDGRALRRGGVMGPTRPGTIVGESGPEVIIAPKAGLIIRP